MRWNTVRTSLYIILISTYRTFVLLLYRPQLQINNKTLRPFRQPNAVLLHGPWKIETTHRLADDAANAIRYHAARYQRVKQRFNLKKKIS